MNKKVWLVIIILSMILATRSCIKDQRIENKKINKPTFASEPYKINIPIELEQEVPQKEEEEVIEEPSTYTTRMTSFYSGDECNTGSTTASGLSESDFNINEHGWYTYQDKLVIATASYRLKNWEMTDQAHPYNLYDELTIIIDGMSYNAIVLDVCGACMRYNRIDLFVSSGEYAVDKYVEVKVWE